MNNIRNIDLNLLVTLEALLTERNVTRAARRLHLSQPSVSVQLRKLRQIFADPLLSPAPGGMFPTTRGQSLLQPLRTALADMGRVLEPRPRFDPSTAGITWQIAAADYAEYAVLLPLLAHLRKAAPGVCTISRNGPARFRVKGPTLDESPAEPRLGSSTGPF